MDRGDFFLIIKDFIKKSVATAEPKARAGVRGFGFFIFERSNFIGAGFLPAKFSSLRGDI